MNHSWPDDWRSHLLYRPPWFVSKTVPAAEAEEGIGEQLL